MKANKSVFSTWLAELFLFVFWKLDKIYNL